MKRLVGGKQFCSKDGCPKSFPNHQWGPAHFPDWVAEWRAKKKLQGE